MRIKLSVVVGLPRGKEFIFEAHDVFLAGRSHRCHLQADERDKAFSRVHFLIEINPPLCRLVDLGSRNGTMVNGRKVGQVDLRNGDQIQIGQTALRLTHLSVPTIGAHAATDEPLSGVLYRTALSSSKPGIDKLPPGIPRQVGNYRILRTLGQGIAGTTCAAVRESDNSAFSVKIIDPPMAGARPVVDKLLHDFTALQHLDDKRILRIHESGQSGRQFYLVTDFVPGVDAEKFLQQRGPLAPVMAIGLIRPVLLALEHAHSNGIIHGAIKPSNILIEEKSSKGRVYVSDMGVNRVYESSPLSGLTVISNYGSAMHYLPPERLTNYRRITPASDQYSVAATLYFLLTGKHPYEFSSPIDAFARIINDEPTPVQQRREDVPDELAAIIHRGLARETRDRFGSIADFRLALEQWLEQGAAATA